MVIVVCSGVMRSGSTFTFNVCRALFMMAAEQTKKGFHSCYLEGDLLDTFLRQANEDGWVVVKTHTAGPLAIELTARGLLTQIATVRDPLDCVASRQAFIPGEDIETSISLVKQSFGPVMHLRGAHLIDYRDIVSNRPAVVAGIMRHLRINPDPGIVMVIAEEMAPEKVRAATSETLDEGSQLHPGHVGTMEVGRWRHELSDPRPAQIALAPERDWYMNMFGERDE